MAVMLIASIGCQNKPAEREKDLQQSDERVSGGSLIDPVDKEPVDVINSKYSFVYKSIEYNFNSKKNMEAFVKDPAKYLKKD